MNYGQKIINRLLENTTQEMLVEQLGSYQSTISAIKNGERNVPDRMAKKISEIFGYDYEKLMDRTELSDEPIKRIESAPEGKTKKRPPNPDKQVPIYDVDFMAGNGIAMFEDAHQEVPMYYMDIPQFNGCEGFRAYNDSMEPKIKSGSILFGERLENWHEHLEYGQIYGIVCHDNRRYLKYIKKWHENPNEYFNLVSENTFYDEFEILKKEIKSIWLIHGWLNKNT